MWNLAHQDSMPKRLSVFITILITVVEGIGKIKRFLFSNFILNLVCCQLFYDRISSKIVGSCLAQSILFGSIPSTSYVKFFLMVSTKQ